MQIHQTENNQISEDNESENTEHKNQNGGGDLLTHSWTLRIGKIYNPLVAYIIRE